MQLTLPRWPSPSHRPQSALQGECHEADEPQGSKRLLERVVYFRVNYALREIDKNDEKFYYYLPNNARVGCDRHEVGVYMRCIISSIFQDNFFRRVITGLAGRNLRKGLEIFLDFCKSGHISEDLIFKIRQSEGDYKLPQHLISKILLKGNRRYYYDKEIKSLNN